MITQLLFRNEYRIERDPTFFSSLIEEIWNAEFGGSVLSKSAVHKLAYLALEQGQDPNITTSIFSMSGLTRCMALHISPPSLSIKLVHHGANVNVSRLERPNTVGLGYILPS
jgi:hypothetical protein